MLKIGWGGLILGLITLEKVFGIVPLLFFVTIFFG